MKTKKKNRFLTFCFSMLPGAAEMYMGFMKTGVSLMSLFMLVIMVAIWMNQGVINVVGVVIWFYGFFHANHLAGLADEDFAQVKDEYLFGMDSIPGVESIVKKYHKWIAAILIFLGASLLWNSAADVMADMGVDLVAQIMWRIGDYVPSLVIGVAIVVAGIKLIGGKEASLAGEQKLLEEKEQGENRSNSQEGE